MTEMRNQSDDMQSKTDITSSNSSDEDGSSDKLFKDEKFSEITKKLDKFTQWVFELEDFQSLQILVFEDFSYNRQYSADNMLLCRNADLAEMKQNSELSKNYHHLTKRDQVLQKLLHKYSNILQACPTDLILKN